MSDLNTQRLPALERLALRNQWLAWEFRDAQKKGGKPRKVPINPFTGRAGSSSDPATWASFEFANDFYHAHIDELAGLGYAFTDDDNECGVTSDGVTGVDIDGCINEDGEIDEWILPLLAETYCEITPSGKGLHFLVDGKWDLGGKKARIFTGARIEIYRGRRYFSITGKQVEGSSDYINPAQILMAALFRRGEELATEAERKAWAIEAEFAEKVENNEPPKHKADITNREREYALESLTKAAAEVAAQTSNRNTFLNAKAFHLGTMVGASWIEEAPIFAALEDACRQNGLWREDGPTQCRKSIRSGLRKGRLAPRAALEDRHYDHAPISDDEAATYDTRGFSAKMRDRAAESAQDAPNDDSHIVTPQAKTSQELPAEALRAIPELFELKSENGLLPFPVELTDVHDGIMGDIIEWLIENNLTPNRTSALIVALSVMVNFTARHFYGPSRQGTGTHMYLAFLGGTGSGKGSIHRWIREITDYVCDNPPGKVDANDNKKGIQKFKSRIKPGRYTSASTLERHIKEGGAASMLMIDEIGDVISSFNGPRASEHMKGISNILMELWGINTGKYEATAYVADVGKDGGSTITHPAVSVIGLSTHDKFWKAFSGIDIASGFANRFLVIQMPEEIQFEDENADIYSEQPRDPILDPIILENLNRVIEWGVRDCPVTEGAHDQRDRVYPIMLEWDNQPALRAFLEHRNMVTRFSVANPDAAEYIKRTPEQAVRLATVFAISCGRFRVTRDDMIWGIGVANYSAQALYSGARAHMAASQHEALINRIIHMLVRKGPRGKISRSEIQSQNKKYRPREINEAIESALDSEFICDCTPKADIDAAKKTNGRVKRIYARGKEWPGDD
jgi:hypothetical protein